MHAERLFSTHPSCQVSNFQPRAAPCAPTHMACQMNVCVLGLGIQGKPSIRHKRTQEQRNPMENIQMETRKQKTRPEADDTEKLTKGRLPESTEVAEIRGAPMIVLLLPLSDARKYSRRQDPGGRRLGSTEIAAIRAGGMISRPTVGPLWGSEIQPEPRSWRETSGEH